jgi:predicted small lipoprotein YifL
MRRSLVVVVLLAALLQACGDDGGTTVAPADRSTVAPSSSTDGVGEPAVPETPEALQFSAPTVDGGELDFRGFAGETVALWFWAPT